MFNGCTKLARLEMNNWTWSSATSMTNFLQGCTAIDFIRLKSANYSGPNNGGTGYIQGGTTYTLPKTTYYYKNLPASDQPASSGEKTAYVSFSQMDVTRNVDSTYPYKHGFEFALYSSLLQYSNRVFTFTNMHFTDNNTIVFDNNNVKEILRERMNSLKEDLDICTYKFVSCTFNFTSSSASGMFIFNNKTNDYLNKLQFYSCSFTQNLDRLFADKQNMTELTFSSSSVTSGSSMNATFSGLSLKNINLNSLSLSNISRMNGTFKDSASTENIYFTTLATNNVSTMTDFMTGLESIQTLTIPTGLYNNGRIKYSSSNYYTIPQTIRYVRT